MKKQLKYFYVLKKGAYGRNTEKRKFSRITKIKDTKVCREMFIKTIGITTFRGITV